LDFASAGRSIAARMAMMAMTTSSSIRVKARFSDFANDIFIQQYVIQEAKYRPAHAFGMAKIGQCMDIIDFNVNPSFRDWASIFDLMAFQAYSLVRTLSFSMPAPLSLISCFLKNYPSPA
jgi:hypothetical protein